MDCSGTLSSDCADRPLDVPIVEKIAHEDYDPEDPNQYHDIALLRLFREVPYTDFIKPICLPDPGATFSGNNHFVAGWGKTENRSESNIKLKVNVSRFKGLFRKCLIFYFCSFRWLNIIVVRRCMLRIR